MSSALPIGVERWDREHTWTPVGTEQEVTVSIRRIESVVIGPGAKGLLKVSVGSGENRFVVDAPTERIPPHLRVPNARFVSVVEGRTIVRVDPSGDAWLKIQDLMRAVLNREWVPIGVADMVDDEYDGYIAALYASVRGHATESQIAAQLKSIEVDWMELPLVSKKEKLLCVARQLRALDLPSVDDT